VYIQGIIAYVTDIQRTIFKWSQSFNHSISQISFADGS
jgi:hypothetical protein